MLKKFKREYHKIRLARRGKRLWLVFLSYEDNQRELEELVRVFEGLKCNAEYITEQIRVKHHISNRMVLLSGENILNT